MAGHKDRPKKFSLCQASFLTSRNIGGKKCWLNLVKFTISERDYICTKRQNLSFTGEDLSFCSRMRVCVTGQHNRRVKFLAGHCPLTSRYFEPCRMICRQYLLNEITCCPSGSKCCANSEMTVTSDWVSFRLMSPTSSGDEMMLMIKRWRQTFENQTMSFFHTRF